MALPRPRPSSVAAPIRGVRIKADGSPVTPADETAEAHHPRRPRAACAARCRWSPRNRRSGRRPTAAPTYFLVDPLDGTREFIAGRDEYTVNIGLDCRRAPGARRHRGSGARAASGAASSAVAPSACNSPRGERRCRSLFTRARRPPARLVVMVSRSHLDAPTQRLSRPTAAARRIACGSSIKFCRLAEGLADHLSAARADPRLGRGGRPRHPRGGRRQRRRPQRRSAGLRHPGASDSGLPGLGQPNASAAAKL